MDLGLTDKSVLVLASSKGLGKAIALKFAEEGARVMIAARDEEQLKKTAAEIIGSTGAKVNYQVCDIKKTEEIKSLVEKTVSLYENYPAIRIKLQLDSYNVKILHVIYHPINAHLVFLLTLLS